MMYAVEYLPTEGRGIEIVDTPLDYMEFVEEELYVNIIVEIPNMISHWDKLELCIFYQWMIYQNRYIPINLEPFVDKWISGERIEHLNALISVNSFDASCPEDIEDHDRCIELLKIMPTKR